MYLFSYGICFLFFRDKRNEKFDFNYIVFVVFVGPRISLKDEFFVT